MFARRTFRVKSWQRKKLAPVNGTLVPIKGAKFSIDQQ